VCAKSGGPVIASGKPASSPAAAAWHSGLISRDVTDYNGIRRLGPRPPRLVDLRPGRLGKLRQSAFASEYELLMVMLTIL
jgi:hypothetical protein